MKTGMVLICNENGEPHDSCESYIEPQTDDQDEIAMSITSIENKCNAIDALFDSIVADLFQIGMSHIDDNGREIADRLAKLFKKAQEDYYYKAHEASADGDIENGWMYNSYLGLLYHLKNENRQTLVIPEIRRRYEDVVKNENLSKEEKEAECEQYIAFIRKQFGLSEEFK